MGLLEQLVGAVHARPVRGASTPQHLVAEGHERLEVDDGLKRHVEDHVTELQVTHDVTLRSHVVGTATPR